MAKTTKTTKTTTERASAKTSAKRASAAKSAARTRSAPDARPNTDFICNVFPSKGIDSDWTMADSLAAGAFEAAGTLPTSVDLRAGWWAINNQENTGSCVGWATADGVVRRQLVGAGRLAQGTLLSPRHVWMASKETDEFTQRPESFIEGAGTSLKAALDVSRKFGVALMDELPFHVQTAMYTGAENPFWASCAQRKIASYFNLRKNLNQWQSWLANTGPILAALSVDASWDDAASHDGRIDEFKPDTVRGGHAICVVGYRDDGRFIVRNSWGTAWGDKGYGYVNPAYIAAGFFDEAYGVTL